MLFHLTFKESSQRIPLSFKDFQAVAVGDYYEGDYEVIPAVDAQALATKQKLMKSDVTIHAIPTYSVSNTSGGSTFYIATMDEDPSGAVATLGKAKLGTMILKREV